MKKWTGTLLVAAFVFTFSGNASETLKGAKKDYESFKNKMTAELAEIDQKLEKLRQDGKQKGKEAGNQAVKDLEIARDLLKKELNEVKDNSSDSWKNFKVKFAKAVDKLNNSVQKALKE